MKYSRRGIWGCWHHTSTLLKEYPRSLWTPACCDHPLCICIYIYIHSWVYMWDSKTLRLVTRVEMIERPFGHIHIYYIYIHSCWRGCNSLFADLDHPGGGPTLMANDFPQTWMIDGDWICGRHCWDASVTTPTSFALLSMWCNLHLASQFRILQGGPFFYSNYRKVFQKS